MSKSTKWLDGAAVGLSALCLIHCLALPLVVAGLPFLAQFAEGHLHAQMLVVVLPLSIVALGLGYRHHRNGRIVAAGAVGMLLLTIGKISNRDGRVLDESLKEALVTDDGKVLYPVASGIPVLLEGEAVNMAVSYTHLTLPTNREV